MGSSAYDLTVFKVHFRALTLKLYDKEARVLRVEALAHNVKGLRCGKAVEKLSIMLGKLQRMVIDFLNVLGPRISASYPTGDRCLGLTDATRLVAARRCGSAKTADAGDR